MSSRDPGAPGVTPKTPAPVTVYVGGQVKGHMLKFQINAGADNAIREKRVPGTPLQRVRILEHIRGTKWRAKWIAPNPGLIDYVDSSQLIVHWREHKALLKEEADQERIREYDQRQGYLAKSPVAMALEQVFGSVGDDVTFSGCLNGLHEANDRGDGRAWRRVKSPIGQMSTAKGFPLVF